MKNKKYKILIVDDNKEILNSLVLTLKLADDFYSEIETATNGETALVKMMKDEFDLVLADYKMPGMNGVELLSKVNDKYPNTARILITGYSDISTAKDAINKAKVDNYVEKPWHNDELRSIIYRILLSKTNREFWNLIKVDKVEQALNIIEKAKSSIPKTITTLGPKELFLFEFKSSKEFNKFNYEIKKMKNVNVDDLKILKDKFKIKISVY